MAEKIVVLDDQALSTKSITGTTAKVITFIAIAYTLLEVAALQFITIDIWVFKALVLMLVFILGYMTIPFSSGAKSGMAILDWLLMAMGIAPCLYIVIEIDRLQFTYGATVFPLDVFFGVLLLISLLELVRRAFGLVMPLITLGFLAYAFFGQFLPPDYFGHAGLKAGKVMSFMLGDMAVFGMVMSAMVHIIFLFMMFSTFIQKSGAGDFFTDVAKCIAGRFRGGPAKVSVFSSSLFGTISGSSVANVAVDGGITIPLMMKTGYRPAFAAAMEATASTGGQIMPPLMGAGAFIMAELLGISYTKVMVAAAIPAVLYYVALYCMSDLEAVKQGLRGLPRAELPEIWQTVKDGGHLVIPIVVLLYQLIILGSSISRAGLLSIASIIVVSWFRKKTRLGFWEVVECIRAGALSTVSIASMCALAGIIVGVVSITGLGIKFGLAVLPLSGGINFITLFLTAIICLLLGMGLPTTASYIIAAAIGVPALLKIGLDPLPAHLFVFYFACMSAITPPQCGAIYTAVGFSRTNVFETGWVAMRLAFPAYIVPFIFIYHPVLLMDGSFFDITYQLLMSCLGVAAMSMALLGASYFGGIRWSIPSRMLFSASFFGFIIPSEQLDMLAAIVLAIAILISTEARSLIIGVFASSSSHHRSVLKVADSESRKDQQK